jgi:hypothetical protein
MTAIRQGVAPGGQVGQLAGHLLGGQVVPEVPPGHREHRP